MSQTEETLQPAQSEGDPQSIKVLMYHRIVDDRQECKDHWTSVHVQDFRRQLEFLDRWGYTAITTEDYLLFRENRLSLPKKPVIITFDDGYLDTYQYAFPLLREFGMRAIVFVLGDRTVDTNNWDNTIRGIKESPLMDDEQIIDMHEAGFEIGAHTMTHANLPTISEDEALFEIEASKDGLEDMLDAKIRSFSYPYGLVNENAKRIVQDVGFEMAYSVGSGPALFGKDIYETRRTTIYGRGSLTNFAMKMFAPYQRYEWARWKAGRAVRMMTGRGDGSSGTQTPLPSQNNI